MLHKQNIKQIIPYFLIGILSIIRPLLGPADCYFEPTCMPFAKQQLLTQPLHKAFLNIIKRLIMCSPLYPIIFARR